MVLIANIRFLSCLMVCSFLISKQGHTQAIPENIQFERITIPGTIRSSQVSDIIQDNLGLIWMAGHGLYRYDGFRFRQYGEVNGKGLLNPDDIHFLHFDPAKERLLLGTHRFGVVVYDEKADHLVSLPTTGASPIVNCMAQTSDGTIWASSFNSGLFYLRHDSLIKLPDPGKDFLHPSAITSNGNDIFIGEQGKVLMMTSSKIREEILLNWQGNNLPFYITALSIDRQNRLWIGTEKQGVLVYDLSAKAFIRYFSASQAPFFSKITKIKQDHHGLVWILTKANGLVVCSEDMQHIKHLTKDPFSLKSLSTDNCFSILEDKDGVIWIGGTGDINQYDRHQLKFRHIYHNPQSKLSLSDNMVRGVYEDHDEKIWIGTDGGYINIIDTEKETVRQVKVRLAGDSTNYVPLYFTRFNRETLLIGTSSGLLQMDLRTQSFSPFRPLWNFTRNRTIRQVLRDESSVYFIYNGDLYLYNLLSDDLQRFSSAGDPVAHNITALHIDDRKRLWVGSNKGVSVFDKTTKTFRFIRFENLPAITAGSVLLVLSIQQVGDYLYVGTFNAGFWKIDIRNIESIPRPEHFIDKDELQSNTIYGTVPDDQGNLWLSTNNGLVKFEINTRKFTWFSISEGLQEDEFNRLAFVKRKNGELIFGGINGINIFQPAKIDTIREKFEPSIVSLTVHNPLSKAGSFTTRTDRQQKLVLTYDQNFINIHFFVPYYANPKRYTLFYRLEGLEKDWKEVTHENIASYPNLPPGTYNFLLKSVGLNKSETSVSVPFTIAPPYWKRWWFIALSFCVVAFLVMTIIRSYIRKAQHDRQRLQELLRIRTSEIEKSREELHILNQKKDLIFSILSHDLRSPLTTLKGFLGYLIDHAHELTRDELKKHAVSIKNSVTNSLDLIDNTLFWSLSQMGNIQYSPTSFSLPYLLGKLKGLYQLTADKKRIPLTVSCPDDILIYGDENMIYVTLRNLVSNALKFTSEGNPVIITCAQRGQQVEINVSDKGIGMSEDYLRRILSMEQPMIKKGTSNEKGTGLGLLLCKKFIEENKGELRIASIENVGTTFTVILPLAVPQHLVASSSV
jgi:signal transduction histidine kinase/ligand-binding sensor domain-containing protein